MSDEISTCNFYRDWPDLVDLSDDLSSLGRQELLEKILKSKWSRSHRAIHELSTRKLRLLLAALVKKATTKVLNKEEDTRKNVSGSSQYTNHLLKYLALVPKGTTMYSHRVGIPPRRVPSVPLVLTFKPSNAKVVHMFKTKAPLIVFYNCDDNRFAQNIENTFMAEFGWSRPRTEEAFLLFHHFVRNEFDALLQRDPSGVVSVVLDDKIKYWWQKYFPYAQGREEPIIFCKFSGLDGMLENGKLLLCTPKNSLEYVSTELNMSRSQSKDFSMALVKIDKRWREEVREGALDFVDDMLKYNP
jgi:hypothetical protein